MAACSLGKASNIKCLDFSRTKFSSLEPHHAERTWMRQKPLKLISLVLPRRSGKPLIISCDTSSEAKSSMSLDDCSKETEPSRFTSPLIPRFFEVESLLTEICGTTSIAEFELKLDNFRLYVKRNLDVTSISPPISPPATTNRAAELSDLSLSVFTPSLTLLHSPKVGYFRRSRTIKGKRAPPSCIEKQQVKEGQVLCFIEQLGGEIPLESDVSGEVVKILQEDGEPVGYGDALIAIQPSVPG